MLAPLPSTNRYVPHGFFKIESFTVQPSPGSQENSVASTERASYSLVTVWEVYCPTVAGEKLMLAPLLSTNGYSFAPSPKGKPSTV